MKLKELYETPASDAYEKNIMQKLQDKGFQIWKKPAGSDISFPDIGAVVSFGVKTNIGNKPLYLHIEAKMTRDAQMGSVRDWIFDGHNFFTPNMDDPNDELVISLLNASEDAKHKASTMLAELQKYFHPDVKTIQRGSLNVIKDKKERYAALVNYQNRRTTDTMIARVKGVNIGKMIIDHYKAKFNPKPGYNISILIVNNEMFRMPINPEVPQEVMDELCAKLDIINLPDLPKSFDGTLEVRVQPRGLSKKGEKPVSLDVMANLRAKGLNKLVGPILK